MGLIERIMIKISPNFQRRTENWVEHHFLEMNRYLRNLREFSEDPEMREITEEFAEDYLVNHLPRIYDDLRGIVSPKVLARFQRKYQQLQKIFESNPYLRRENCF